MSDTSNALHRVLTALAVLGEATPKAIATEAELGYSTVTPKLRSLAADELAVSGPDASGKTVWKLTPKGVLAAAVTSDTLLDEPSAQPTAEAISEPAEPIESPAEDLAAEQTAVVDPVADGESDDDGGLPDGEPHDDGEPDVEGERVESEPVAHDTDGQLPTAPIDDEPDAQSAATDQQPDEVPQTPPADEQPTTATDELVPSSPHDGAADPLAASAEADEPADAEPAPDSEVSAELRAEEQDADGTVIADGAVVAETGDAPPAETTEAADKVNAETAPTDGDTPQEKKPRRRGGSLKEAALKVLQDSPDEQFRVGQVCKAINAANTDPTAAKASQGAVSNALVKWLNDGVIQRTVEKPATYQAL